MHSLLSVVDPGCLSRIRIFSIPDPNVFHPRSRIRIKNLSILTQKNGLQALGNMIRVAHPGSGSWFFTHLGSRWVKKAGIPDLGSGSATLALVQNQSLLFCSHVPRISALLNPDTDTHFLTLIACLIWKFSFLFLPKVRASVEASLLSIPLPSFNLIEENAG